MAITKEGIREMNLHQKILKIADMAGVLQKTASGYSYRYVPEEDIQAKVTAGLQKYGVMLYNSIVPGTIKVVPYTYEKYDARIKANKPVNEILVSADMTYTWVNVDNPGEKLVTTWALVGQMEDAAQAMGAGLTYGNRYYLMKQLQLATTESDPDNYRSKQKEAADAEEREAERAEKEVLDNAKKRVIDGGKALMKAGATKEQIQEIVAKYNDGNGNPSTIKDVETCDAIAAEFEAAIHSMSAKKEDKGEANK